MAVADPGEGRRGPASPQSVPFTGKRPRRPKNWYQRWLWRNGTRGFPLEYSIRKNRTTRCSFAPGNFSVGKTQKVLFHLHVLSNRISRKIFVNGKQPLTLDAPQCKQVNKSRLSLIVRMNVVLNRTVVVDSNWRFDNLCDKSSSESKWVVSGQLMV